MDYGKKEKWFDVDEENIDRIRKEGFWGKSLNIGDKAAYAFEGYEVISKEEYNEAYGIDDLEPEGEERE